MGYKEDQQREVFMDLADEMFKFIMYHGPKVPGFNRDIMHILTMSGRTAEATGYIRKFNEIAAQGAREGRNESTN